MTKYYPTLEKTLEQIYNEAYHAVNRGQMAHSLYLKIENLYLLVKGENNAI